jgi:hypothetical protein
VLVVCSHDDRRESGKEIDDHPARSGGDKPDQNRAPESKSCIERLMRAQNREPRQRERLEIFPGSP